jgi:uncharacterized SAM-binding protein YcdF (DUF218 family)
MDRARRGGLIGLGVTLLLVGGGVALERQGLAEAPAAHADAIVVLGCSVEDDGTASPCLAARTDAAVALWKEGRAPKLVLTGGGDGNVAEAGVAAARAHAAGVPRDALVIEGRSTSTETNARFAAQLIPPGRLILVTDAFHVPRAERCFRSTGNTVSAQPVIRALLPRMVGAVREVAATAWYAVSGRCRGAPDDGRQNRPPSVPP